MKKNIIMVVLALVLSVSTLFFAGTPVQAASCGSAKQCITDGLTASGTSTTPNSFSSVLTTCYKYTLVSDGCRIGDYDYHWRFSLRHFSG